eukprot:TRINITY_DN68411_c0_g1_i1.p1 TRINITY_DN68411_c0_g1~~TRINITY_DN68411_c0_g1_i1.p1  ORF type:complete len:359 (-),score=65.35 TRINITY_DN68411_c0_g1_i1:185-1261(-)
METSPRLLHAMRRAMPAVLPSSEALRAFFAGSGSYALNTPKVCAAILGLTGKVADPSCINVVYVGTATYDLPEPMKAQTVRFVEAGCQVRQLSCVDDVPQDMEALVQTADVILVSGGNTLFAVDRWFRIGLANFLRAAMDRGCVLAGGSAGAICWFDAGHSDSHDPETYKTALRAKAAAESAKVSASAADSEAVVDESSTSPGNAEDAKPWEYIRVPGLGFLPGLVCPHHDKTQSNGVLRAVDFDSMLLRHPGERGLGIDHCAALVIEGACYRVFALDDEPGSVLADGAFSPERSGRPGIWLKEVVDGVVVGRPVPAEGRLSDLLKVADGLVDDPRVESCRNANPDDSPALDFANLSA